MVKNMNIFQKFYKHLLIFLLFLFIGNITIDFVIETQKKQYLKMQTEMLFTKYKTNYKYFEIMSQDIYSIYKDNPNLINSLSEANDANQTQKASLRNNLYTKLKKRYKRLKNMGILQFHIHLANNVSFLRMHKPEKFGDDLSSFRDSVRVTNETKKPQSGFEIGRFNHGFRFIYPLFNKEKHVGSIEISFSSDKLISSIADNFILHTHFLLSKKEAESMLRKEIADTEYETSIESPEFLLQTSSHIKHYNNSIHNSIKHPSSSHTIKNFLSEGNNFSISSNYNYESIVGSFIAIKNIQKTKTIAYLAVYSDSDYLDTLLIQKKHAKILFTSILLLLLIFSVYVTTNNQKLRKMAHFDELTSLPNRAYFYRQLDIELSRSKRLKSSLAVMFLDLDGFKSVNDIYGHDIGDKLLIEVSKRLIKIVRDVDIVARLGGDEFTIVLTDIKHTEDSLIVANKIIEELKKDFIFNNKIINIGVSIGISIYPDLAQDADTLIKQSDSAMYIAKENGKNQAIIYQKN